MKAFIVIVMVGFIAVGLYLLMGPSFMPSTSQTATTTPSTTLQYASSEAGISFAYANTYKLEERNDSFEGQAIKVITLIDRDVVIPDMGEGPPAISILVIPNASSTPVSAWIKAKSISNFNLSMDQKLSSTTIDAASAVSYTHSGLYESQAVAVSHQGKIYLLSVGSIDPNESIVRDFQNLLKTVDLK